MFAYPSVSGNKYEFILYDYNSNTIHADPITSRTQLQLLHARKKIIKIVENNGLKPCLKRLENECYTALKEFMDSESIKFQITPTGLHFHNLTECAIQTFKKHFIAGL